MRTRRPLGMGRMPSLARSLGQRDRAAREPSAETAAIDNAEAAVSALAVGLGGLFTALRQVAEQLGQVGGDANDSSTGQENRIVFGYSVRTGQGGGAEPFGNIAETTRAPDAAAPRQPIIDIHADGADVVVIAELPGVDETGVEVALKDGALLITAPGWRKHLELPAPVMPASLRRSCRNGILQVRLARQGGAAP